MTNAAERELHSWTMAELEAALKKVAGPKLTGHFRETLRQTPPEHLLREILVIARISGEIAVVSSA